MGAILTFTPLVDRYTNRELLENFMGVRPTRRHVSMRHTTKPAGEKKALKEKSFIEPIEKYLEEERDEVDVYDGLAHRYDDWPFSVAATNDTPGEMKQSCLGLPKSRKLRSNKRDVSNGRRLTSHLACVRCVVGVPNEEIENDDGDGDDDGGGASDEGEKQSDISSQNLFSGSYESKDEEKDVSRREGLSNLLAVPRIEFCSVFNTTKRHRYECVNPCVDDSFDSYEYELSVGSITADS
jgi:hypothetical protein